MHKPTIHRKTSKSSFLHHPLTKPLLTMLMFSLFPYDLLFSSYTMVRMIQLKMYISRNVRILTSCTSSPRTNRFIFNEYIQSSWAKLCQKVHSRGCDISTKWTVCVLYAILARTENLHFAMRGRFVHRWSHNYTVC